MKNFIILNDTDGSKVCIALDLIWKIKPYYHRVYIYFKKTDCTSAGQCYAFNNTFDEVIGLIEQSQKPSKNKKK